MIMTGGVCSAQGPWRVVLLGKTGVGKSRICKGERSMEEEMCEKKILLVDTPGWDKRSVDHTSDTVKQEIVRSVTQPPGSHVLLLVMPVTQDGKVPSDEEIQSHCQHIQMLSEKAWRFTMVLFSCEDEVEQSLINQHLEAASELLEKCDKRCFTLKKDTSIPELHQEIKDLVSRNSGDCLTSQDCYEALYWDNTKLKRQLQEMEQKLKHDEDGTKKRRGSAELLPPTLAEGKVPEQSAMMTLLENPTLRVIIFLFVGGVLGVVIGATDRSPGTGLIIGCVVGVLLAILITVAIRFSTGVPIPTGVTTKPDTGVDLPEKPKEQ